MRINLKKLLTSSHVYAGGGGVILALFSCFLMVNLASAAYNVGSGSNCHLDSQDFVSVTIGNIVKAPPITVPVNMTCTLNSKADQYFRDPAYGISYCWHYHNDPNLFDYRRIGPPGSNVTTKNPKPPYINYNLYGASNGLKVAGKGNVSDGQYNMIGWAKGSGYEWHMSDAVIMRFEGNEGMVLTPGTYSISSTYEFHGGMAAMPINQSINFNYPAGWCRSGSPTDTTNINDLTIYPQVTQSPKITVKVLTYCNMSIPTQAAFPTYASLQNVRPITATLNVDCSAGTHFQVDSNLGLHAIGNQRYMKGQNSDATISYNIDSINSSSGTYTPDLAAPLQKWTDYGNGTPAGINYDIQLSIPRQPTPPDDTYRDTIIYTLNHIPESGDVTDLNNMAGYTVH